MEPHIEAWAKNVIKGNDDVFTPKNMGGLGHNRKANDVMKGYDNLQLEINGFDQVSQKGKL